MINRNSYILAVGSTGSDRLSKLNKMLVTSTHSFFKKIGLKKGHKVLEIGCGTGNVTTLIAEQVGINGSVTALDINAEQIAIAKEHANSKKLTNITFHNQSVLDKLPFSSDFDIVYSRLTIMHVANFQLALKNMYDALKPGGVLACEEASNAHYIHYPFNAAYNNSRILLLEISKQKGMDPYIGDKLYGLFHQLELTNIAIKLLQPIYSTPEERSIIPQFFEEVKENYITHKLITEAEANDMSKEIKQYAHQENTLITFPIITQIWAKKALHTDEDASLLKLKSKL